MRKKKVCIITGGHWAAIMGGAQYQVKCLLGPLVAEEDLDIFYLAREVNHSYKPKGYKILQIAKPGGIRRYGFFLDFFKLRDLLKEIKPDVIYQRGLQSYTGIAAHYAKRNNCEFIFHIAHDYDVTPSTSSSWSKNHFLKYIEKKIGEYGLINADKIIAQTQHQSDLLKNNYQRQVTAKIPNSHPIAKEVVEKQTSPIKVVWVANFKPMKRPEMFVQLAEDLLELDNVKFIMIGRYGNPKLYKPLHDRINRLANLEYLGEKSIDEVNSVLASSHIFVNTSVAEGFPNTFIQAWMRHVPVVSASVNTDGVFNDSKIGFCSGTYLGMKDAVVRLVNNAELRTSMGQNAYFHSLEQHSPKNMARIVSIIKE